MTLPRNLILRGCVKRRREGLHYNYMAINEKGGWEIVGKFCQIYTIYVR